MVRKPPMNDRKTVGAFVRRQLEIELQALERRVAVTKAAQAGQVRYEVQVGAGTLGGVSTTGKHLKATITRGVVKYAKENYPTLHTGTVILVEAKYRGRVTIDIPRRLWGEHGHKAIEDNRTGD